MRSAANEIIKHKAEFTLFIAEKNSLCFDLIQLLIDDLNNTMLQLPPDKPHDPPPDNEPPDPVIHPAVSYTHLDVYKRQASFRYFSKSAALIWSSVNFL